MQVYTQLFSKSISLHYLYNFQQKQFLTQKIQIQISLVSLVSLSLSLNMNSSDEGALVIGHSKDASLHTFEIHLSKFNTLKKFKTLENDDNGRMGAFF